jgi:hypothetical protein
MNARQKSGDDIFQLLTATYSRRLLQGMQDPCAEAEDDPFVTEPRAEIVLSAAAAEAAGRSLAFAADDRIAAPDWLILCETHPAQDGRGAIFGFAARLPGEADDRGFVYRAYAVLFARAADAAGLDHYAGVLTRGEMSRGQFLKHLVASSEALERRWRFALLPLDGELTAAFGAEAFDDLHPPRFVIEDL